MKTVNPDEIEDLMFYNNRRSNMGWVNDPGGRLDGQQKGYTYWYRCVEHQRLEMCHKTWLLDDAATERFWLVDGIRCPDLPAACLALSQPPLLSVLEAFCLFRLPPYPCGREEGIGIIAGAVNPNPCFFDVGTRWSIASHGLDGLYNKDVIGYHDGWLFIK